MFQASFGFGKLLLSDHSLRLGLFVLGCSPGGTVSNFWTLIFGGDLELSVTMTFVSTIASIGEIIYVFFIIFLIYNNLFFLNFSFRYDASLDIYSGWHYF